MSKWIAQTCRNCYAEFFVHEDWDNVSDYCKECLWYTVDCKLCYRQIPVNREWDNVPTVCKDCKAEQAAKWYDVSCRRCGTSVRVNHDWSNPPSLCNRCKEEEDAKWYDKTCRHCGGSFRVNRDWSNIPDYHPECAYFSVPCAICGGYMKVHRAWDNPPKAHKECREREAAKWYEAACKHCGRSIRINREWSNPPEYHDDCAYYYVTCEICNGQLKVHRGWSNPPRSHKECIARFKPKDVSCSDCGKCFTIKTHTLIKCHQNGWDLPKRCQQCKEDQLLITGAVESLRDTFPFAIVAEVTQQGFFFPEKVVLVKSRKTGEVVAEVKMDSRGCLVDVHRVAEAFDARTGKRLSSTRAGREGFLEAGLAPPKRTADTYRPDGTMSHRTVNERRGFISPRDAPVTRRTDKGKSGI